MDVGLAQARQPLTTRCHYYEVEIVDAGEKCYIALGLARRVSFLRKRTTLDNFTHTYTQHRSMISEFCVWPLLPFLHNVIYQVLYLNKFRSPAGWLLDSTFTYSPPLVPTVQQVAQRKTWYWWKTLTEPELGIRQIITMWTMFLRPRFGNGVMLAWWKSSSSPVIFSVLSHTW